MTDDARKFVKIDSWHIVTNFFTSRGGFDMVETRCGLTRQTDGTFLDRLPGGDEKSCENCLMLTVNDAAPEEPKKKAAKKK